MYKISCLIFSLVFLFSCKTIQHLADQEVVYLSTDETAESESAIEKLIEPYKTEMSSEMDVVIAQLSVDLYKKRPNSNLGNWFADLLYEEANQMFFKEVDAAFQNYGGLRIPSISAGDVTRGKIYELMPFDNTLVVMELEGHLFKKFMDRIANSGGWPISHTVSFHIGEEGAENIKVKDQPFSLDSTYRIAIPDYVARGGDRNDFLKQIELEDSGVYIRDVILAHLEELTAQNKIIVPDTTLRISY